MSAAMSGRRRCRVGGHDEGHTDLADHGRGDTDDGRGGHVRMLGKDVLHLQRVDVVATADVHVARPADEHEVAIVIEAGQGPSEEFRDEP